MTQIASKAKIKLSVCITAYNRPEGLERTLRSLSRQSRQPDEVIVSDDCSPRDPKDVIDHWSKQFRNFYYNRNENNLNMPGNLNLAISLANGEYIANLHDSDEFDSTLLEKWEKSLDENPTAGFVFSGVQSISGTGSSKRFDIHPVKPITNGIEFYEKHLIHRYSSYVWGTVMARREAYQRLLPFNPKYEAYSDVDMWIRMCKTFDVAYVNEALIHLDDSPATWRNFDWKRIELVRMIQFDNVIHFYSGSRERLNLEISKARTAFNTICLRQILGRVRHRDPKGIVKGLVFFVKNYNF